MIFHQNIPTLCPTSKIIIMNIHNLSDKDSLVGQFLTELRDIDIQMDRMRFRKNLHRIGQIMAYEISKHLDYGDLEVETQLGVANSRAIAIQPVLATIFRAGIPMHNGFLSFFDQADNAFVSAYRREHKDGSFEIKIEYVSAPDLEGRPLIICDPMLATGLSMTNTLDALREFGEPSEIHIATILASSDGIEHVERTYPNVHVWTAAIDEELTARSYIVPGLGDAGDLAYGAKGLDD